MREATCDICDDVIDSGESGPEALSCVSTCQECEQDLCDKHKYEIEGFIYCQLCKPVAELKNKKEKQDDIRD